MRLPVLKDSPSTMQTCHGKDYCGSCKLYVRNGGICSGCTTKHKEQMPPSMQFCAQTCSTCAGYKVSVPAVCCRSPHKELVFNALCGDDWNKPVFANRVKRSVIALKQRGIMSIANGGGPSISRQAGKLLVDESKTEAVAVNLPMVYSGRGFYSTDLHDYLRLPKKVKLLLLFMCMDDLLERYWDNETYRDVALHEKIGLSWWMPPAFSAYVVEPHMHQYYQLVRTLKAAEQGQAWFTSGNFRRLGLRTDDMVLSSIKYAPQLIFNAQFGVQDEIVRRYYTDIQHYHKLLPHNIPFWIVGSATPPFMATVRSLVGTRVIYYVSANIYMSAIKGKRLFVNGKVREDPTSSRWDLIQTNTDNFRESVKRYG